MHWQNNKLKINVIRFEQIHSMNGFYLTAWLSGGDRDTLAKTLFHYHFLYVEIDFHEWYIKITPENTGNMQ